MGEPIKIVVIAETDAAKKSLDDFLAGSAGGLKKVEKAAKDSASALGSNRMALMELGHSARSVADGLAAGMSPLRLLMMETPRITQAMGEASAEFRTKLLSFLPALAGVGVAIAAGAVLWHYYGDALVDPTKRARELADALEKIPDILKKVETAERSGSITSTMAQKYRDMISGKTPLYNQDTVADPYGGHAQTVKNGMFGMFGEQFPQLTTDPNIRNPRTGAIVGQRQPANQQDINTYVTQQERGNATMANDDTNPGDEARAKLKDDELKIQRDAEVGDQKEIDRIKDRYELERRELAETRDVAVAAHKWTADDQKKYDDTLAASRTAQAASIAEIQQKSAEESAQKIADAQNKIREANAKDAAEQIKNLESQITAGEEAEGEKRSTNYFTEYAERSALYAKLLVMGTISEDEYSQHVVEATHKALEAQKEYLAELQKEADLRRTIARAQAEGQLRQIQQNPFLTDEQKSQQSVAPTQVLMTANSAEIGSLNNTIKTTQDDSARQEAQQKIIDLMNEQVELQHQLDEAAGRDSLAYQFQKVFTQLQNLPTIAQQSAQVFSNVWNTAANSISSNLTKVFEGTENWHKAILNVGRDVVGQLVQSFIHMGVTWVEQHVLMAAATKLLNLVVKSGAAESTTATTTSAMTQLAAHAAVAGGGAAAAESSIPYVGPILAVAAMSAMVGEVLALGSGFSAGGYTGYGGMYDPAGIVHRNEFVFNSAAVDRIGVDTLDAIHNGTLPASAAGSSSNVGSSAALAPKVVTVFDRQSLMDELKKPDYAHITVQHVLNNRARIGIRT